MSEHDATCDSHEHGTPKRPGHEATPLACQRAADIFRALGDPTRLRILTMLMREEMCVTEIAAALDDNLSAVSQRLKLLRSERVVRHRRDGKHVYYGLADQHIAELVSNALAHAGELDAAAGGAQSPEQRKDGGTMSHLHANHTHQHGPNCGHKAIEHEGHTDYLHDGHLHHQRNDGQVEEHALDVTDTNPADCTPSHDCGAHEAGHVHGPGCGHEPVPHGDHTDYLVDGHLHHPHGTHCDDHGPVSVK